MPYKVDVRNRSTKKWENYATNLKEPFRYCFDMMEHALFHAYSPNYDCDDYNQATITDTTTNKVVCHLVKLRRRRKE